MMRRNGFVYTVVCSIMLTNLWTPEARSQQYSTNTDPKPILRRLINAFRTCGPPHAYQILGPQLYQTIFMQTGGMGCYQQITAAGSVTNMQVEDVEQLPAGPIFTVRVTHQSGFLVDWFIGFSNYTGKVEYLTFVAASPASPAPTIQDGPTGAAGTSPVGIPTNQTAVISGADSDCAAKWGTMCQ
ncbi:hypothetical protein [Rhizobium sp. SAFR-030]|uniref:hypothetical protein n=1 Tax=Rhizobium sp. SAFR-030 TaxID=3387277 RepID=UPI003F7F428A